MDEYCELLYIAELVKFGKRCPRQMSKDVWLQFLKDEQLLIEGDVQHSIAEVERGQVDFNKLKALKGEPRKPKDLLFLRIGKYDKDDEHNNNNNNNNFLIYHTINYFKTMGCARHWEYTNGLLDCHSFHKQQGRPRRQWGALQPL
jgi:hypothetical protein